LLLARILQARDTKTMSGSSVMIGIDVASTHVEVAAIGAELSGTLSRIGNEAEGHTAVADGLARLKPARVLMEATGGYEAELACALQAAGLRVAVVNPRMARGLRPSDAALGQD
jgi:transposase